MSVEVGGGIYVVRLTVDERLNILRGRIRRLHDGREWSFASGTELANLVADLGHTHEE